MYYLKVQFLIHREHCVSITKPKRLPLFWEINTVYYKDHKIHMQMQNSEAVPKVATVF